jgi:hypothetical protein
VGVNLGLLNSDNYVVIELRVLKERRYANI